ncbi:MAG: hypothetical protein LBL55_02590, partial [Propionibacteriaceae bacterium]|nr:hypothetical protein [Propionibacteriaceae bacterium]
DDPTSTSQLLTGDDGVLRRLYNLPGEINGKAGTFQWIVDPTGDNPVIVHQLFSPNGGTGLIVP